MRKSFMMKSGYLTKSGFTLIELLVVIAIVGILSAIILVALNSARKSSRDARVKSDIAQVRRLAEAYNLNKNTYLMNPSPISPSCTNALCTPAAGTGWLATDDPDGSKAKISELAKDITTQVNLSAKGLALYSSANSAVFLAPLPSDQGSVWVADKKWYCQDTKGNTKIYDKYVQVGTGDPHEASEATISFYCI